MRPITPADLGQPASYVEPDLFRSIVPDRFGCVCDHNIPCSKHPNGNKLTESTKAKQIVPIAFSSSSRPIENDVQFDNGVSVHPIIRTDYKGEKFGQTTTYEVRWATGVATCKTAEAAAEVAIALSERLTKGEQDAR